MNLSLKFARRYFFSKNKKQFINIISIISMIVVAVGTMALIIALSVFNGLEGVVRRLHDTFNAELQITPVKGKSFEVDTQFLKKLQGIKGIAVISEVIEDNAVLKYREGQMVVKVKGVSDNYQKQTRMDSAIVYGEFATRKDNKNYAVIGRGVQYRMSVNLSNQLDALQLWYPRRSKKINIDGLNPEKSFNRKNILPIGVFSLEQSYDEKYVFVPLQFMEQLLEYGNKRTSLEIKTTDVEQIPQVQTTLKKVLGKNFSVKNAEEQQASLLKAIQVEKLFVYITLSFILAVASFNIFFSLMMLVIDKKKDIAILEAMGANRKVIRNIFLSEGVIIAFSGALSGLFLGTFICLLQQEFGFVSMGTATTVVSSYPVKLQVQDFVYTGITIVLITVFSAYFPAVQATKVDLKENL